MSGSRSSNLRVQVDVESNFTGEKSFKSAESAAFAMAKAMDAADAAARRMAGDEAAAYRQVEQASAAAEAQVRKMAQAEIAAYREVARLSNEKAKEEAAAYREGEQIAAKREADVRRMAQVEAAAYREAEQAEQKAAAARRMSSDQQREALAKVGTVMAAGSVAAITGLGLATKAAMDWESAWAGVTKTVDGTPAQMEAVENSLRSLSTRLPATHQDIAAVAEAAGQLGVKRPDIIDFTSVMLDLGETTNLSSEEAATGLAKFMNVMKTAPEDVGRLGATLVALGNDGASTEADILAMAQRISGAGKLVGASEADVLALANALSSVGVEAELGGGVTTRVLQKIYSAVKEGGDGLSGFAEVAGMSSQQFAAAWESSPVAAMDAVFQGLNRVKDSGGNVVETLSNLGLKGTEEATVLLRMAGAGDLLTRSLELGGEAWQENAALAEEANKRYQTTEARLQIAKNKINETAIDIGGNLLPALAEGGEFVGDLASAFSGLSDEQQTFATALGAGAAGITGIVGVAAVAVPKVVELKDTLDQLAGGSSKVGKGLGAALSVMTGPWGLAIAGATVILGAWAAKQGEARQRVEELSGALNSQTGEVTEQARRVKIDTLVEDGVFDQAERFGIALDVVTDAALGSKTALAQIAQLRSLTGGDLEVEMTELADGTRVSKSELLGFINTVENSAGVTDEAAEKTRQKAEAMGEDASATDIAAAAAQNAAAEHAGLVSELTNGESAATGLEESLKALSDALDVLNGGQLDANAAARQWEEAIDSAQAALEDNGKTLDITTEKGRANQSALDDMAKAAMGNGLAMYANGASYQDFRGNLEAARESLFTTAKQFGMSDEAAHAYVESVLAIPSQAQTNVMLQGTDKAKDQLDSLLNRLAAMPHERATTVRINEITSRGGNTGGGFAHGGVVDYFANGGITSPKREDHVAQIAPAGSYRVWAEEETPGLAYIPLPRQRPLEVLR